MKAQRLLDQYERVADAADAIPRLRRFVLDLAVRGMLVTQNPHDEPASELQARLAATHSIDKVEGGRRGKRPVIAAGLIEEPPYPLPSNWVWARMGGLGDTNIGLTYSPADVSDEGYPVLRSNNIQGGRIDLSGLVRIRTRPKDSVMVQQDDILICARNGSRALVGKAAFIEELPEPMAFGAFMAIFRSPINRYLHLFISSPVFRQVIDEVNTTTINQITQANLRSTLVALPPLDEQLRIIAKVDELMSLCDRLEVSRTERESMRDKLTAASLSRLNAPNSKTFREDARFVIDTLPSLAARADQIKELRQSIINLAVCGKLVLQDPNDEPAQEALRSIRAERAELVRSRTIRREKPLEPVRNGEPPFDIPATWVWTRIGEATLFIQYGSSAKAVPSERGVPVLTMGNIQDGLVVWSNEKRMPEDSNELPSLFLKKFDLLYNRTNSAELVGKTGIYLGEDDCRTFASYLIRLRFSLNHSSPRYMNLAMNAPSFRETQIIPLIKKQTGQANVNGTALKNMLIPFPPLAEQHRIVAKVDKLMALCDRLEATLATAEDKRCRLLNVLLHEALAPDETRELEAAE